MMDSYLIKAKEIPKTEKKNHFQNQIALIYLGLIGFCCMASEGVMFDWSGVYFKDVIHAPGPLVILGILLMITMAGGRFFW
jgi:hypothetical protein